MVLLIFWNERLPLDGPKIIFSTMVFYSKYFNGNNKSNVALVLHNNNGNVGFKDLKQKNTGN